MRERREGGKKMEGEEGKRERGRRHREIGEMCILIDEQREENQK